MTAIRRITAILVVLLAAGQLAEMSRGIYPSHVNQAGWVISAMILALAFIFSSFRKENS